MMLIILIIMEITLNLNGSVFTYQKRDMYKLTKSGNFYRCLKCNKLLPSHDRRVATFNIHETWECRKKK